MSAIVEVLRRHSEIALFLMLALGYLVGKVRFGGMRVLAMHQKRARISACPKTARQPTDTSAAYPPSAMVTTTRMAPIAAIASAMGHGLLPMCLPS